jgi:murein L,D-transpeptidase YafK
MPLLFRILLIALLSTTSHAANVDNAGRLDNAARFDNASGIGNGFFKADAVIVKKSEKALYLMRDDKPLKRYHVVFGPRPKGHKLMEGDERTPEGLYTLDFKNPKSGYYKSIRISYPNQADIEKAKKFNVHPGGNIMIHGIKNSWSAKTAARARNANWTDGCIALSNSDMDELWEAIDVGTPISILP